MNSESFTSSSAAIAVRNDRGGAIGNPRQRIIEQRGVVDWYTYWLQDTCTASAETCARWKTLRAQRDAAAMKPRPPRLRWSAVPVTETAADVGEP